MFVLAKLEDDIRIDPKDLAKTPLTAVTEVIEQRFLDKVIPDVGLVVTIYDVTSIEGGHVYPNDGAAYFRSIFRLVVFRPFAGEVIVGKLLSCNKEGLRVSLGFFEDVLIPDFAMQDPSFYDDNEKVWVWKFENDTDMFMDVGEPIRFKVHSIRFNTPPTPAQMKAATGDDKLVGTSARPFAPMEVLGKISGDGLGLTTWWETPEEQAGDVEYEA